MVGSLRTIESPGAFAVPANDLRIEVRDVGPLGLSVSGPLARKLIGVARHSATAAHAQTSIILAEGWATLRHLHRLSARPPL